MGFYLNNEYISDSYLRYKLLNNNKNPESNIIIPNNNIVSIQTAITPEDKDLLNKLNAEILETNNEELINRLFDMFSQSNFDMYSALSSLTRSHLLAILYLLYEGRITERGIKDIICSSNHHTRTEILLSYLKPEEVTEFVDLFKPLRTVMQKMVNFKNPRDLESPEEKREKFSDITNHTLKKSELKFVFGNYFYADKGLNSPFSYCPIWFDTAANSCMPTLGTTNASILSGNSFNVNDFYDEDEWDDILERSKKYEKYENICKLQNGINKWWFKVKKKAESTKTGGFLKNLVDKTAEFLTGGKYSADREDYKQDLKFIYSVINDDILNNHYEEYVSKTTWFGDQKSKRITITSIQDYQKEFIVGFRLLNFFEDCLNHKDGVTMQYAYDKLKAMAIGAAIGLGTSILLPGLGAALTLGSPFTALVGTLFGPAALGIGGLASGMLLMGGGTALLGALIGGSTVSAEDYPIYPSGYNSYIKAGPESGKHVIIDIDKIIGELIPVSAFTSAINIFKNRFTDISVQKSYTRKNTAAKILFAREFENFFKNFVQPECLTGKSSINYNAFEHKGKKCAVIEQNEELNLSWWFGEDISLDQVKGLEANPKYSENLHIVTDDHRNNIKHKLQFKWPNIPYDIKSGKSYNELTDDPFYISRGLGDIDKSPTESKPYYVRGLYHALNKLMERDAKFSSSFELEPDELDEFLKVVNQLLFEDKLQVEGTNQTVYGHFICSFIMNNSDTNKETLFNELIILLSILRGDIPLMDITTLKEKFNSWLDSIVLTEDLIIELGLNGMDIIIEKFQKIVDHFKSLDIENNLPKVEYGVDEEGNKIKLPDEAQRPFYIFYEELKNLLKVMHNTTYIENFNKDFLSHFININSEKLENEKVKKLSLALMKNAHSYLNGNNTETEYLNLQNSIGKDFSDINYYRNSSCDVLFNNIMEIDMLMDDGNTTLNSVEYKEGENNSPPTPFTIHNFGNMEITPFIERIIDYLNKYSDNYLSTLGALDLLDKRSEIESVLVEAFNSITDEKILDICSGVCNFNKLEVTEGMSQESIESYYMSNFSNLLLIAIAKEIVGNYIFYLFPKIGRESVQGRITENPVTPPEKIIEIFNFRTKNDDYDFSLPSIYARASILKYMILSMSDAENDILDTPAIKTIIKDPCNCNSFFEGMCEFADRLQNNNLYTKYVGDLTGNAKNITREYLKQYKTELTESNLISKS